MTSASSSSTGEEQRVRHVPARDVPIPSSVSAAAQAALAVELPDAPVPPADDHDAWRERVVFVDQFLLDRFTRESGHVEADVDTREVAGATVHVVVPLNLPAEGRRRVYVDLHGGALVMGGGDACRAGGVRTAGIVGVETWAVDYRMPPDHPYPAGLDDCVAVYRALIEDLSPAQIIVGGGSAGGNLAAATILRARDEGLPLPAAAVLVTPQLDLTESGDSFNTNLGVDTVLTRRLTESSLLYADGHDLGDPYLSPLFGDFTKGFCPTFIQAGTRDLFLSNAARLHRSLRRAGVPAELHVFEAMPHGGFGGSPEDDDLAAEWRRFVDAHWG